MTAIEKAIQLKKELDALRPLKREDEQRIMQKFRLDWNFHSNHLEGNSLTYGETKALILFNITAQGKPLKDHIEITGHNEAVKWIEEVVQQKRPLTENFIRELHKLILKEPYEVDAITADGQPTKKRVNIGVYKTLPNHVLTKTGEIFRFASPEETPTMMTDLINWYREKLEDECTNPIFLAAEFHYKFIRIHPFDDGNGRTARILMNFILMQQAYPPVIVKTQEKQQYLSALQQADAGIFEPFLTFIAENLVQSLDLMIRGAKGGSIEDVDDLDKELALLKAELEIANTAGAPEKTANYLHQVYDKSLRKLKNQFINQSRKFSDFYLKLEFSFLVDHKNFEDIKILEQGKILTSATNQLTVRFQFETLNFEVNKYTNFVSEIFIYFDDIKYSITNRDKLPFGSNNINSKWLVNITKPYNQQLTEAEINQLVNTEINRHKAFIGQKIEEIKNNNENTHGKK